MTDASTLTDLIDDAALLSFEHQTHLREVLGEDHTFHFDVRASRFEFRCSWGTFECTGVHLLGSAAPGPRSWLWSWANPMGFAGELVAAAESVREFGIRRGIPELSCAEVSFDDFIPDVAPHQVSWTMMEAVKPIAGHWTGYQPDPDGTFVAFLLEHPLFELPAPTGPGLLRVLSEGMAEIRPTDQYRAARSYLTRRGLTVTAHDDTLRFHSPAMDGSVDFDEYGNFTGVNGTLGQPA